MTLRHFITLCTFLCFAVIASASDVEDCEMITNDYLALEKAKEAQASDGDQNSGNAESESTE